MKVSYRVTGKSPDEIRAAADEVAREFAGDASFTVEIGEVYGELDYSASGQPGKRPSTFGAMVTATVDGKPAGRDR